MENDEPGSIDDENTTFWSLMLSELFVPIFLFIIPAEEISPSGIQKFFIECGKVQTTEVSCIHAHT